MFKNLSSWLTKRCSSDKCEGGYKIQSFTFYIPSPPERKVGYREKQFDKVFFHFINRGYKIISTHVVPNNNPSHSGMWFVCLVQATTAEANALDLETYFNDQLELQTTSTEAIIDSDNKAIDAQEEILYVGRSEK
ncbi:MAG: hypothetical protein A2X86_19840 [Bdellovibrionales bacterium GWA2_49_15]|nr:MAG: hypothetical protein A2X86_19840 [Bdellovibrionales bacterium GWA2_49_15]HAZ12513.1 hypothetical protein [Bdellovibrionales bacterium]